MKDTSTSGLRTNRSWQWLWRGQSVSVIGDMVFLVTVMLWIATKIARQPGGAVASWAPAAVSGALIAVAVPGLVVGPFAGVWVDRWNRRRTMLTADAARFLLIGSLLVLPLLRHRMPAGGQLAILYAVLAAASCFAEFFDPSRLAIIGVIVRSEDQPKASGQLQAAMAFAQVIGPPVAAPLLVIFGVQWALILNAVSFGVSFLCIRAIRVPATPAQDRQERAGYRAEFRAGLRFFASSKILVSMVAGAMTVMLGAGAVNAIGVFFVLHNLHASAGWIGVISGAVGVGAIAGASSTGALAQRIHLGRLTWLALLGGGLALAGLSRCTSVGLAIVMCALLGVMAGIINAADPPIMLRVAPQHMLGRVSSVVSPLVQLSNIAAMAIAGLLASTALRGFHAEIAGLAFGPYNTILAISGLLFIAAGLATIAPMRDLPAAVQATADATVSGTPGATKDQELAAAATASSATKP
jgi:MFS family permease